MKKRVKIKNSELEVSFLGMGTVRAGVTTGTQENLNNILSRYVEQGGNFIDTAHVYSDWVPGEIARSERVVGDWLEVSGKRKDIVLATKGGHPRLDTMHVSRMSEEDMRGDLESSLEKLRTDYIDIYFYHRDDESRSVEELIERMEAFKREGKIRYYACSNWSVARMKEADAYCSKMGYRGFVANQAHYNIATRHMGEYPDDTMQTCGKEMLDYHRNSDNLLVPYLSICSGFFSKLQENGLETVKDSCYNTEENLKIAEKLVQLCERKQCMMNHALLGFFDVQDLDMAPLFSVSSMARLEDTLGAYEIQFEKEDYAGLIIG